MNEVNKNLKEQSIAVLIPCLNEAVSISKVVKDFTAELPSASIHVFDNDSDDNTVEVAKKAGAIIHSVTRRGKGNVVRAMFRQINADVIVMVDGDDTYFSSDVHALIKPILERKADMVIGDRLSSKAYDRENTRRFHGFGNRLVRWLINKQYRAECKDILSGYRVFSQFFVSNFPVMSSGFEIETEMMLHALDKNIHVMELPINYQDRQEGSESKLNTFADGLRILQTITLLFKNYKPMIFFGGLSGIIALTGLVLGAFPIAEYIQQQYIHKVPLAILAASLEIMAILLFCCGLILDTVSRQHKEQIELRMLDYLKKPRE